MKQLLRGIARKYGGTVDNISDGVNRLVFRNSTPPTTDYGMPVRQIVNASNKVKHRDVVGAAVQTKSGASVLLGIIVVNASAAAAFIQVFDSLIAGVTLGTTTPDLEFVVPAGGSIQVIWTDRGVAFATGIAVASTTAEKGAVGSAAGVQVFIQTD